MKPIVLFDGTCAFCERSILFVAKRDPAGHFRFGASQTPEGGQILAQYGVTAEAVRSMVLIEDGRVFMKSSAALRIARRMQWPWPLATMCLAVPRLIRDAVYMLISRNRHRLLRNADVCAVPPPELRGRIITS